MPSHLHLSARSARKHADGQKSVSKRERGAAKKGVSIREPDCPTLPEMVAGCSQNVPILIRFRAKRNKVVPSICCKFIPHLCWLSMTYVLKCNKMGTFSLHFLSLFLPECVGGMGCRGWHGFVPKLIRFCFLLLVFWVHSAAPNRLHSPLRRGFQSINAGGEG